jgi:hypothetical protein
MNDLMACPPVIWWMNLLPQIYFMRKERTITEVSIAIREVTG